MGQLANIICDLEAIGITENIKDYTDKNDVLLEIHMALSDDILGHFPNEIQVVKDYGPYKAVLGYEEPEKIIEIAEKWNDSIIKEGEKLLKKVEEQALKAGETDIITYTLKCQHPDNRKDISILANTLQEELGRFCYGCEHLVKSSIESCYTTLISEDVLTDIKKNPKNYICAEIIYD